MPAKKKKKAKPKGLLAGATPVRKLVKKGQLLTYHDAVEVKKQHTKPCADCPFARTAVPEWLAGKSPGWWMRVAHGDGIMECHTRNSSETKKAHQCAGAAIFRANVLKSPRDPSALALPRDTTLVFANDREFRVHHKDENPDARLYEDIPEDSRADGGFDDDD